MGHEHSVHDSDARFIIDPVTRMIKNDSKKKLGLIQGDHNSEVYSFTCPRYIEFHDMSLCDKVEVHFFNYEAQTKKVNSGKYTVTDLQVGEDEETVVFSWKISGNGTQLQGHLEFLIRFKCTENDVVNYAWNTSFFTDVNIGKGSNADESFETEYVDIIEQWKASVIQIFEDEFTEWKNRIETQVSTDINRWKQETEEGLTDWKKAESDEVHQVMGDYEAYMNRQHAELKARMDTFTSLKEGSTTGDAELIDVRIGADGEIYNSAGEAVRNQINNTLARSKSSFLEMGWADKYISACKVFTNEYEYLMLSDIRRKYETTGGDAETTFRIYSCDKTGKSYTQIATIVLPLDFERGTVEHRFGENSFLSCYIDLSSLPDGNRLTGDGEPFVLKRDCFLPLSSNVTSSTIKNVLLTLNLKKY